MVTDSKQAGDARPDAVLLEEFVRTGSEEAFRQLVEKYLGMLTGIALRRTGDASLSEEIVQDVFAVLARKAKRLKATPTLAGWLYCVTTIECAGALRKEGRRAGRMKTMMEKIQIEADGESVWREAIPFLDEALERLPEGDRNLILLRFWEGRSFREIGGLTGKSEGATQKQAERALRKLGGAMQRREVTISATALTAGLPSMFAHAAPAGAALGVSQAALATASGFTSGTVILKSIEIMTYAKTKTALAVAVLAAVPIGVQWNANQNLSDQVDRLEQQLAATVSVDAVVGRRSPQEAGGRGSNEGGSGGAAAESGTSKAAGANAASRLASWEQALNEKDPMKRSLLISQLIGGLTPESAPEVAAIFERARSSGARFTNEFAFFMRAWGGIDGQAAAEYAAADGGALLGTPEMVSAIAGWAGAHPEAARAWVEALQEGQAKEDIIAGLIDGWATSDIEGASRYAETRPRTPARNRIRQLLLERVLMEGGIPAGREWFAGIDGEGHNRMYKQLGFDEINARMLEQNPREAADWIKRDDGAAYLKGRAIRNTAYELAQQSPAEALEWMGSLEHLLNGQKTSGFSQILKTWAEQDPNAAGAWLNENDQHPEYDAMANRFILTIADIDAEAAMAWAGSIADETRRRNSLLVAGAGMLEQEGEAAIPQLKAAGFTDEMIRQAPGQLDWARSNPFSEQAQLMTVPAGELPVAP